MALAGRYVGDEGKPLGNPAQQPYGEFRMMPIDLKVVIEQRDIPRLLAECANSAMRIDVRAVRVLVDDPRAVDLASGATTASSSETTPSGAGPMLDRDSALWHTISEPAAASPKPMWNRPTRSSRRCPWKCRARFTSITRPFKMPHRPHRPPTSIRLQAPQRKPLPRQPRQFHNPKRVEVVHEVQKKFDPKVIQQFLIDHTEKFVIGLVALLFLYFAYTRS